VLTVDFCEGEGLKESSPKFEKICIKNGVKKIRCYTRKKGIVRILKRFGYVLINNDYMLEKELK